MILGVATQEQRQKAERSLGIHQDNWVPVSGAAAGKNGITAAIVERSSTSGEVKLKIRIEIKDTNASFWTEYDGEMVRAAVTKAFLNSGEENIQTIYHRELPWGNAIHGTHLSSHKETITVQFPESVLNTLNSPTIQIDCVIARFHRKGSKPGFYNTYDSVFVPLN
ncbi:hypothetical protein L0222_00640 [bacterium]|nr:hypothetical protein [bacterium]